jgi:hypothetical protein
MSTGILKKQLGEQRRELNALLEQLLALPAGLRGTFSRVYTRCGKAACWCARQPRGHPHTRLTWSENGQLRTRKVPAEQAQEIIRLTQHYRRSRALRRQLRMAITELLRGLERYEQSRTDRTRSALKFLPPPPQKTEALRQNPSPKGESRKRPMRSNHLNP